MRSIAVTVLRLYWTSKKGKSTNIWVSPLFWSLIKIQSTLSEIYLALEIYLWFESIQNKQRQDLFFYSLHSYRLNELARRAGLTQTSQQTTDNTKETYLNQDLAVNLLLENQNSLRRCEMVSTILLICSKHGLYIHVYIYIYILDIYVFP